MNFVGKTAIVTGGCTGIGKAIAFKLAHYGADVAIIDVKSLNESEDIIRQINNSGRRAMYVHSDVADFMAAEQTIIKVFEYFGCIDILVNNAGINRDGVIWKMTEEQWDSVIDVDLKGCFNFIRAVSPYFKEQKYGKIVNITSINGIRGKFGQSNYSAAKAGVIGLTKAVAKELGRYSVNVNAVAPGLIETEMMKKTPGIVQDNALKEIVLNRFGQAEDVANLVAFLCSDLAKHITGEVIKVDGGQYI